MLLFDGAQLKLSAQWIRDFVDLRVDDLRLAEDLTSIGLAVEGIFGDRGNTVFEMEIGTNRPDAMNHYGVAREASTFYGVPLKPLDNSAAQAVAGGENPRAAAQNSGSDSRGRAKSVPLRGLA